MLDVEKLICNQVSWTTQDAYVQQTFSQLWLSGKILFHQMTSKLQKFFTDFRLHSILAPASTRWWYRAKTRQKSVSSRLANLHSCLNFLLNLTSCPSGNSSTTATSATTLLHYSRTPDAFQEQQCLSKDQLSS